MKYKCEKYKKYSKALALKYLIILMSLILIKSQNQSNIFIFLLEDNQISLKVKGNGYVTIFYPSSNFKPSSYYLNSDPVQKEIINNDATIELHNSENLIKLIFSNTVTSCSSMFMGCSNILEIDLSNFDSSSVQSIDSMFQDCTSLKKITFGNFKTSQITSMGNTFQNCSSLETLDLSSFDISNVIFFHYMFYGCSSLKYLDLSNFDTSSQTGCVHNLFYNGCEKLEFVNFRQAKLSITRPEQFQNMFGYTAKNIVFCADESNINILNQLIGQNDCSVKITDCSNWRKYQKKIVPDSDICVNNCLNTSYPYEYLGRCYERCPNRTIPVNYICYDCSKLGKCPDITPTEFKNQIKEKISDYINSSKVINGSNFLASIISSDEINPEEQLKNGISAFDLGNCTNVLKEHYRIPNEENLIILNMEIKNENDKSDKSFNLGKNTQLEIYDYSGNKLDLSVCHEDIKIFKYIGDVEEIDIDSAKSLSNQGIDLFNPSDKFFNDLCHNYDISEGKDIILTDRRNDIYQNVSFCQYGCKYKGMNYNLMAANCICDSSFIQEEYDNINFESEESINFNEIKNIFLSNLLSFNLEVLRCYNLVIDKKIIITNIGLYCLFIMFILQIIFFFIYLIKKLKPLKHYMLQLNNQKSDSKQNNNNKKNINIINNKSYKKIDDKTISKNKIKSTPPPKIHKELRSKNKYRFNQNNNLLLYKSKNLISSNNISKHYINIRKSIILPKNNLKLKNYLMKGDISEEYNNLKEKSINNKNSSIYNIKSEKRNFLKRQHIIENESRKKRKNCNKIRYSINNKNININKKLQNIYDMQDLDYEEAILTDKRGYLKMYWGFLVDTQIILGTFCTDNHLDLFVIKLSFFIFTFQISFFLNALFYTDEYISNAYHNDGVLDIISGLPKSIYSYIATLITTNLLRILSSSKSELIRLIKEKQIYKIYLNLIHKKLEKLRKKLIVYFILLFLLSLFFLYHVAAFCAVYKNSQKYWFLGCLESFGMDSLVSLIICIFLSLLRFISIKKKIKYMFTISNFISNLL